MLKIIKYTSLSNLVRLAQWEQVSEYILPLHTYYIHTSQCKSVLVKPMQEEEDNDDNNKDDEEYDEDNKDNKDNQDDEDDKDNKDNKDNEDNEDNENDKHKKANKDGKDNEDNKDNKENSLIYQKNILLVIIYKICNLHLKLRFLHQFLNFSFLGRLRMFYKSCLLSIV